MLEEVEKYKGIDFYAHQVVEGFVTGLHRSPFHGFSVEFAEHRQYNAGESTRNIDWKLYGRTDKLFVKRYEEETNLRCQIVIDHSSSMLFPIEGQGKMATPNKLTFATYGAAVLVELLSRQRDAYGLTLLSEGIELQTEARSNEAHKRHVMQLLERVLHEETGDKRRERKTAIAEALHLTAEALHKRSMVVLFTDGLVDDKEDAAIFDALRHLRHCKHEVLLLHTIDYRHEVALDYGNKPTEFIDLESGAKLKVNPQEIQERYRNVMEERCKRLKEEALRYHIDYEAVDVARGFENIMLPFLKKRSKHF